MTHDEYIARRAAILLDIANVGERAKQLDALFLDAIGNNPPDTRKRMYSDGQRDEIDFAKRAANDVRDGLRHIITGE